MSSEDASSVANLDLLIHDETVEQNFVLRDEHRKSISAFLDWSKEHEGYQYRTLVDFGGLEFVEATETVFDEFGISGDVLASCMDGNHNAIRTACRRILKHLEASENSSKEGETHLISRKLEPSRAAIHMFILAAFDGMERYDTYLPIPELNYLLKTILSPSVPALEQTRKAREKKYFVVHFASEALKETGEIPSMRHMAKLLGLSVSSVSRMFEGPEHYRFEVQRWGGGLGGASPPTSNGVANE